MKVLLIDVEYETNTMKQIPVIHHYGLLLSFSKW